MLKAPETIRCVPFIKDINPYKNTTFEKYLLNKPALHTRDDGEKIVIYHFIDFNSTEYFPVQVMLHPQKKFRGYYKLPSFKVFHFPKPKQENYFEIEVDDFESLGDVDKVEKFKKDLIRKGFISEEDFKRFVEDKMNYHINVRSITTHLDFALSV